MTIKGRERRRQAAFETAVKDARLIGEQEDQTLKYGKRLEEIQWGSAAAVTGRCVQDFALFLDHIWTDHGVTWKSLIVADHSGVDRWQMVAMQLSLSFADSYQLGLTDSEVWKLERAIAHLVSDQLLESHGDPATISFELRPDHSMRWKRGRLMMRPSVVNAVPHLTRQAGYVIPIVARDLTTTIAMSWSEIHDQTNPYEMLLRIYRRGVLVDFAEWRFTNASSEDLGRLPEAPL